MAMKEKMLTLVAALTLVLFGAISGMAQDQPAAQDQSAAPAAGDQGTKPAKHHAMAMAASETLSGTITTVDADKKIVVVSGSNGVPYDFMVSGATRIKVGGSKAKLADLSGDTSKQATVTFMAEKKRGNIARSIEVTQ
jgi:hypothetical protein